MLDNDLIREVCEDIYQVTGIKPVLYDADMRLLYAHPLSMGGFCKAVRRYAGLDQKCLSCDRRGFERCKETGDICIYQCHMGLTEAAAPILDNGVVIGYLLFGQLLSRGGLAVVRERINETTEITDQPALLSLLNGLEEIDDAKLRAAARLISMCACYIRLHRILQIHQESMAVHIAQYIEKHLGDPALSIPVLCAQFGVSRSTLYAISKKAFGLGITQYMRDMRLKRAVELIREGNLRMYQIAEQVGIADADYLTKLLKKTRNEGLDQVDRLRHRKKAACSHKFYN